MHALEDWPLDNVASPWIKSVPTDVMVLVIQIVVPNSQETERPIVRCSIRGVCRKKERKELAVLLERPSK